MKVPSDGIEFLLLETHLHTYLPAAKLVAVDRVQNSGLYHQYKQRREVVASRNGGDPNDKILFHGTGIRTPESVVAAAEGLG